VVEVRRGGQALSAPAEAESFLRGDYRLACQAVVLDPAAEIEFAPLRRRPKILVESLAAEFPIDPGREGYGVAVDLGTTTIVMDVVSLETGVTVCRSAFENPQRFGGSDVMHRISYDSGPYRGELHKSVINALNGELKRAYEALALDRHEVREMVVVGNSTMRDLFFNFDVQSIGQRPYKSAIEHAYLDGTRSTTAVEEVAHRLGILTHPKACIYGGPLVASHVGADSAADLAAIGVEEQPGVFMLVDVGTNTEVIVGNRERLVCASCPAGPAFEGGLVKYGMTGCDGAIEELEWTGGAWRYRTIGDAPAEGICGSGLIDLLAELGKHGMMTPKGVFRNRAYELAIIPERGITFSREDASNLAQAKAANTCGQAIVMRAFGVKPSEIDSLYLAGGFANYINVRNAIDIGFLAPVPEERIVKIGNASVAGARRMLLSRRTRLAMEDLVKKIEHIELETTPDFFDIFVEGCQFKPL
jgi:uncharacterized 2Fe-2S/4Fe-4S cluster protein (DUF4445 family)